VLLAPSAWIIGTDWIRRFDQLTTLDRMHLLGYLGTALFSVVFWAALLYPSARRRGIIRQACAGVFAVLFFLTAGVQGAFHGLWNTYLCLDSQVYSHSLTWALIGYLPLTKPMMVLNLVGALVLAIALIALARHLIRPRRIVRSLAPLIVPVALAGATQIPASYRVWQSSTPDVIYFHGYKSLVDERLRKSNHAPHLRVQRRDPEPVPALVAKPPRARNVVLIMQESLRFDVSCNEHVPEPPTGEPPTCATPFSNRAAPKRYPFNQMRGNSATTAIAISDIWSGVPSTEGPQVLLSVPLLWDYAHAAGYDTAYWTCQHVMFGSMRLYVQDLPLSHLAVATNLDPRGDFDAGAHDALLTDRVIEDWDELEEPFYAVVHYSNGHFPYVFDEDHAPFQPSEFSKAPEKNEHFKNFYRNVHYLSDMAVGRLIDHIRGTARAQRTVLFYVGDHGEAFRAHWQLGHTSSLYDDEIHVPAWIDAPEGTVTPEELASLRGAKEQYVWHLDVGPTVLDLLGLWDTEPMRPFRARMLGHPITRPERTTGPVPLNNCAWTWECAFRNWGMMQGPMKIEAREWDNEFHCFDLRSDPEEQQNLGEEGCAPLPDVARQWFGPMPRKDPPSRKDLLWGPPPPKADSG
jgi:glucan phosphoethanolaminetransferase (alkaline phosphatase superfamily)